MSSFSITRKKTPFQKHREEEEAKKKVRLCRLRCVLPLILDCLITETLLCHVRRELRMKQLAYMQSSWNHFKGRMRQALGLLCAAEPSTPMKGLRPIPKVSIADNSLCSLAFYFPVFCFCLSLSG